MSDRPAVDRTLVVALLNALVGLGIAVAGFFMDHAVLLIAGLLVAAAGVYLAEMVARSTGRSAWGILTGAVSSVTNRAVAPRSITAEAAASALASAKRVIVVPGYGLAVAQGQEELRELVDLLGKRGVDVDYAIHPVAGRMPGHMNVLLADARGPYEGLRELDEIDGELESADLALVVGANDIVNPAAETDPDSPLFGMPILHAGRAKQVVVIKRADGPGYVGIANGLFLEPHAKVLRGDAKDSLRKVVKILRS